LRLTFEQLPGKDLAEEAKKGHGTEKEKNPGGCPGFKFMVISV